ncbi:MAG: hypothetical protein GXY52_05955 [Chloroflexi bacterium]|nr:hypothetical protein [Chloroflexota bacterium]
MLDYALRRSFEEMREILSKAGDYPHCDDIKKEVNYRVGTFLHWLIDNHERLKTNIKDEEAIHFFAVCVMLTIN